MVINLHFEYFMLHLHCWSLCASFVLLYEAGASRTADLFLLSSHIICMEIGCFSLSTHARYTKHIQNNNNNNRRDINHDTVQKIIVKMMKNELFSKFSMRIFISQKMVENSWVSRVFPPKKVKNVENKSKKIYKASFVIGPSPSTSKVVWCVCVYHSLF